MITAVAVDDLVAAVEATGYHAHVDAAAEVEDAADTPNGAATGG